MKKLILYLCSFTYMSSSFACGSLDADYVDTGEIVHIELSDDRKYCSGNPVFEVKARDTFNGDDLREIFLAVERDDDLLLYMSLALPLKNVGYSTFCLPKEFTAYANVVVSYGIDHCKGSKSSFVFKDLSALQEGVWNSFTKMD